MTPSSGLDLQLMIQPNLGKPLVSALERTFVHFHVRDISATVNFADSVLRPYLGNKYSIQHINP